MAATGPLPVSSRSAGHAGHCVENHAVHLGGQLRPPAAHRRGHADLQAEEVPLGAGGCVVARGTRCPSAVSAQAACVLADPAHWGLLGAPVLGWGCLRATQAAPRFPGPPHPSPACVGVRRSWLLFLFLCVLGFPRINVAGIVVTLLLPAVWAQLLPPLGRVAQGSSCPPAQSRRRPGALAGMPAHGGQGWGHRLGP